ncbi:flagellar motor switch protein FliG [Candidatus Sarmatiella mevalonica]|uniref:flagellar motor switch protein FliG n=1 Tax=Candidatus Sarmatiella mevalonica TaxID=2770581 RepID=UPI00192207C2|nr:flagellar motor switch protein FliG [Candidatus Sarmatiella mevalonica]
MEENKNIVGIARELERLGGVGRVAVLLLSLPEEIATKVMSMLSEDEIKEIARGMSSLGYVRGEVAESILNKFKTDSLEVRECMGNVDTVRKLLEGVVDSTQMQKILQDIQGARASTTWEKLTNVSEEVLATYLKKEHPQTAALVLSKINPMYAAKVLTLFPESLSFDVLKLMLCMSDVKKNILQNLESVLRAEFTGNVMRDAKVDDVYSVLAEIFNNFDRSAGAKYMSLLQDAMPDAAQKIQDMMFTFNDLVKLSDSSIQKLLTNLDRQMLALALKGAVNDIKVLFFKNMTQRARTVLQNEIDSLGTVRLVEVEKAQQSVLAVAKNMIHTNQIAIEYDRVDQYI